MIVFAAVAAMVSGRVPAPGGPNVLLTVRGRSSSREYRVPVAMLAFHDRRFVQAAFGEVGWVRNVRAAGQARITQGRYPALVDAVEVAPEAAAAIMREVLKPFRRSRLPAAVIGPTNRPPVGVLQYFGVRVDDTLDAYVAGARRQPLFELLPHE